MQRKREGFHSQKSGSSLFFHLSWFSSCSWLEQTGWIPNVRDVDGTLFGKIADLPFFKEWLTFYETPHFNVMTAFLGIIMLPAALMGAIKDLIFRKHRFNKMTKNTKVKKRMKVTLICSFLAVCLLGYGVCWAFFDLNRLPAGEYLTEEKSPDGTYTVKAYLTNGGATTPFAVRGELVFNKQKNKTKNIYWNSREETADIQWVNHDTVIINGHTLNVPNDKFDFRNN